MNAKRNKEVFPSCPVSFFPCDFPLQIPHDAESDRVWIDVGRIM